MAQALLTFLVLKRGKAERFAVSKRRLLGAQNYGEGRGASRCDDWNIG